MKKSEDEIDIYLNLINENIQIEEGLKECPLDENYRQAVLEIFKKKNESISLLIYAYQQDTNRKNLIIQKQTEKAKLVNFVWLIVAIILLVSHIII